MPSVILSSSVGPKTEKFPGSPITPAQKRFFIALVERRFPEHEEARNFYYKLIPRLDKSEAHRLIADFLAGLARGHRLHRAA